MLYILCARNYTIPIYAIIHIGAWEQDTLKIERTDRGQASRFWTSRGTPTQANKLNNEE
jgi:hypothetical protein